MSEPTPPPRTVDVVRREAGDIVIGEPPAAPAGVVTVALPGATAYVDPTAPDLPPAVVVGDEDEAAPVLHRLFGDDVARRVLAVDEEPSQILLADTDAIVRLGRYAVLRWLWTAGSLPLDRALLAYEGAVAAENVDDLLDVDETVGLDVVEIAPLAVALARALRSRGDDVGRPGLPRLLDESLDAILRRLSLEDPTALQVRHEAELRRAMTELRTGPLDWDRWQELLGSARPEAAAHAGGDEAGGEAGPPAEGRASVDWARVPPGVLDAGESTVWWRVEPSDGDRLRIGVDVLARRDSAAGGLAGLLGGEPDASLVLVRLAGDSAPTLRFRVYVTGIGLPLAEAELVRGGDGLWWRGTAEIPARAVGGRGIVIDVLGAGLQSGPRHGTAALPAEAMRWAARGTGMLRLALAGGAGFRDGVREPWERARQLFATVAAGEGPDAELARRRQARCDAVVLAYLDATAHPLAARLRRRLEALAPTVRPGDLVIPDLTDPGWAPTVAELSLLAAQGQR